MSNIFVKIDNVSKIFPNHTEAALDKISSFISHGKILGIVGPDGAGKTTLIRLIAGLLKPTQGNITIGGFDTIAESNQIHQLIGYLPQKFGLYEDLTVQQNLSLYADLSGVIGEKREAMFKRLLAFTNLAPFTNRLAGALSGGMKQKLGLACALLPQPQLLLLDEPTVGVDPISRRELWQMVKELLHEKISVVWSTAYLNESERCDTVLLLNKGKALFHGKPSELTERTLGRTFRISNIQGNRRILLKEALNSPDVVDSVIQGNSLRLITRKEENSQLISFLREKEPSIEWHPIQPRFEDAFIDILGGGPGGYSALSEKNMAIERREEKWVIQSEGLTKKFGHFIAADHITFKVKQGEIFGLLGPNGAGKSTTFRMLCGLLKPTSGRAFVEGVDLQRAPGKARAHIGYMAQKFSLYGDLSLRQNLIVFAGFYNLRGKRKKEAIDAMIEIFDFRQYLDDVAKELPIGYKQRLALACAVIHQPEVLFLDEPTSGVDPISRREFWNHINGLVEKGVTVMVTTHFMDEAEYCDRIGLIYQSKMIIIDTPDALKEKAKREENPQPTLEDAFIQLINQYNVETNETASS